jgi:hypothetical protein
MRRKDTRIAVVVLVTFLVLPSASQAERDGPRRHLEQLRLWVDRHCTKSCESLRRTIRKLERSLEAHRRHRRGGKPPRGVALYRSDSCSGDVISFVGPHTRCDKVPRSRVWGIRVDGVCHDISDTTSERACIRLADLSRAPVKLYRSDRCSKDLIAAVGPQTRCHRLRSTGSDAWAVFYGGRCHNIRDTDLASACRRFKHAR